MHFVIYKYNANFQGENSFDTPLEEGRGSYLQIINKDDQLLNKYPLKVMKAQPF